MGREEEARALYFFRRRRFGFGLKSFGVEPQEALDLFSFKKLVCEWLKNKNNPNETSKNQIKTKFENKLKKKPKFLDNITNKRMSGQ